MIRFAPYSSTVFPPAIPAMAASQPTGWLFLAITSSLHLLRARPRYQKELGFSDAPRTTSRVGLAPRQSNCLRNFPLTVTRQPLSSNGSKDRPGYLIDFNVTNSF